MSDTATASSAPHRSPFRAAARAVTVYSIEAVTILSAALLAFLLRFDFRIPGQYWGVLGWAALVWAPVKLLGFRVLGLDRRWARYISLHDLLRLGLSNLAGSVAAGAVLWLSGAGVPRSIYAIDLLLCFTLTAATRISVRLAVEHIRRGPSAPDRKRTLVYGAGSAGAALLRDIRLNSSLPYDVVGFIDDNPHKSGLVLNGLRVLGSGDNLPQLARRYDAQIALIAIPSASGPEIKAIIERCAAAGLPCKTIPGLADLIDQNGLARQIRDVAVEDLLGRTPARLEHERISESLTGRSILVTGAAGSIGSEICRQIARFRPGSIVALDIAESPLFDLQQEMARTFPSVRFEAEIGSVRNAARLREVFERHRPSAVYHAAAYKHVPLMESHAFEAVENNVFGTLHLVEAAVAFGVEEFVMISSDKAVRPTSVMGATKRAAEIVVRSCRPGAGRYVSVRFGNVLGSNGSVVPIFRSQIARGGPVTVTHPEMRRYFMTIPEACQLVLQAATMGRGGEIFVLDMGEPVRIVDLARNLILLSGLRPEKDIGIEFTGIRPGEKLFEEVSAAGEGLLGTRHEKIRIFEGLAIPRAASDAHLAQLRRACATRDLDGLVYALRDMVPEYAPGETLLRRAAGAGV